MTASPHIQVTLAPPTVSAISLLNAITAQGSPVYIFYGLVDPVLGTVIGSPELLFSGNLDTVKTTSDANSRVCVLDVSSAWERLFVASEGERLTDKSHQAIFPGETGLSQSIASSVVDPVWGASAVQTNTTPGLTPGFSGGTNYNSGGGGVSGGGGSFGQSF